jgi:hypothetical protein
MNRLRRGYLDIAPELEPYFVTGSHDDAAGLARTAGLDDTFRRALPLQVLVSIPVVIGVLDGVICGVLTGVIARGAGSSSGLAVGVGLLGGLVLVGLLALLAALQLSGWTTTYQPRFTTPRVTDESTNAGAPPPAAGSATGRPRPVEPVVQERRTLIKRMMHQARRDRVLAPQAPWISRSAPSRGYFPGLPSSGGLGDAATRLRRCS